MNRHYIEKNPPKGANADEADEKQGGRCSVFSYSVLRSYYSELPLHLAHPPDEADGGGAAAGRNGMNHDCLMVGM